MRTPEGVGEEAVMAALKALGVGPHGCSRAMVEVVLYAAAPYMLAECWERAYDDGFSDRNYGAGRRDNPYRSQA